jgi:hypothetical protein
MVGGYGGGGGGPQMRMATPGEYPTFP